jgi:hypothetical protein
MSSIDSVCNAIQLRYTPPVTSKKGVIGIGVPNDQAARSRNLRRSCGFFASGSSFGGPSVGPQGRRHKGSAWSPVRQPVRAATPIGVGVAVVLLDQLEPHMADTPMGAPAPTTDEELRDIAQHDFEAALTQDQINEIEAEYNATWGVKRRITLLALSRSKADLVLNFGKQESGPDVLMEMIEHIYEFRDHLRDCIDQPREA